MSVYWSAKLPAWISSAAPRLFLADAVVKLNLFNVMPKNNNRFFCDSETVLMVGGGAAAKTWYIFDRSDPKLDHHQATSIHTPNPIASSRQYARLPTGIPDIQVSPYILASLARNAANRPFPCG